MREMPLRLVACDLDDTLVSRTNHATESTVRGLRALAKSGAEVVLITGRPVRWLWPGASALGHRGLAVAANGVILARCDEMRVLARHQPQYSDLDDLRAILLGEWPAARFALETDERLAVEIGFPLENLVSDSSSQEPWEMIMRQGRPACKTFCALGSPITQEIILRVTALCGGRYSVYQLGPASGILELRLAGITKLSALQKVASSKGLARENVAAMGDGLTDAEMIEWAGVGVAMGKAHPRALANADYVAPDFEQDGAAIALNFLLDQVE
jgi:HAD superfamily hydrolase (TIGR01484 family)